MSASGEIGKVAAALVKAQASFGPALKTATNPHFKSRYADLGACIEAVIEALNANGIALTQRTHQCDGGVSVETVFLHESGETWSSGPLFIPATKGDAQGYGSALTYARRYSLMAACGHAPEDDDGNDASKKKTFGGSKQKIAETVPTDAGGVISAPALEYKALSPDWQAYIDELATEVENTFTGSGPRAAQEIIDINTERDDLDGRHIAALYSKLGSKTRSSLKVLPAKAT